MSNSPPPPCQNESFYHSQWTRSFETKVLSKLEESKNCSEWVNEDVKTHYKCVIWVRNVD